MYTYTKLFQSSVLCIKVLEPFRNSKTKVRPEVKVRKSYFTTENKETDKIKSKDKQSKQKSESSEV